MTDANYEEERLALDRERLKLEKTRAEMERSFFYKNSGVLLTAAISLAAVLVSATQIWSAYITKAKEIEVNSIQNQAALDLAGKDQELKWKTALLNYVTTNMESIFSKDKEKSSRYLSVMLATFQTKYGYTDDVVQNISTLVHPKEEPIPTNSLAPDVDELIKSFRGPDRLIASNQLIALSQTKPNAVVNALINNVLDADDELSYRVNLYIAFTLSRMESGWKGTEEQRNRLINLRKTRNYLDETFKRRIEEAILNWQHA